MSLIPNSFKFKKYFKGKIRTTKKNKQLVFGNFGLKALESGRLTPKQLEAARKVIKKGMKSVNGLVKIKVRVHLPTTSKAIAARQGRGKGKPSIPICSLKAGTIIFEIFCSDQNLAREAARQGAFLLPVRSLLVSRFS
jgi:large subunit ribosomal protein L16